MNEADLRQTATHLDVARRRIQDAWPPDIGDGHRTELEGAILEAIESCDAGDASRVRAAIGNARNVVGTLCEGVGIPRTRERASDSYDHGLYEIDAALEAAALSFGTS